MFLLDTCTLLWLAGNAHDQLSEVVVDKLKRHPELLFVSAISAFEIGVKAAKGRLSLQLDPKSWFQKAVAVHGLHDIAVSSSLASASTMLPSIHQDPCDRIIIATAIEHGLSVMTPDELIHGYVDVQAIW